VTAKYIVFPAKNVVSRCLGITQVIFEPRSEKASKAFSSAFRRCDDDVGDQGGSSANANVFMDRDLLDDGGEDDMAI
jgi:hypothetical protein